MNIIKKITQKLLNEQVGARDSLAEAAFEIKMTFAKAVYSEIMSIPKGTRLSFASFTC